MGERDTGVRRRRTVNYVVVRRGGRRKGRGTGLRKRRDPFRPSSFCGVGPGGKGFNHALIAKKLTIPKEHLMVIDHGHRQSSVNPVPV